MIAGPALGGLSYALGASVAYAGSGLAFLTEIAGLATLGGHKPAPVLTTVSSGRIARIVEGIEFIRSQPIVLGAISLDLFAVLFGGATALLPIYARDILNVGPVGLGMLRSAPAAGACIVAFLQTRYPPNRRVGVKLFSAVAVFGVATVVFALSRSFGTSLGALVVIGASDMVSVNIRSSLVQLATPDAMRGRVSAVNMLFIGASGELGAFESGVAASICLGLLKVSSSVASGRYWSWRYGWRRFPPSGMPTASSIRTSTGQSRSFDRYRKVKPSAILSIDASPIDGIDHVQSRPATDGAAHCTGSNGGRAKSGYQHREALNTLSTGTC